MDEGSRKKLFLVRRTLGTPSLAFTVPFLNER